MNTYNIPLTERVAAYIVISGADVLGAKLVACGVEIGEWKPETPSKIPREIRSEIYENTRAADMTNVTILDFLEGAPIFMNKSIFASFFVIVRAKSIPSVTAYPVNTQYSETVVGGKRLVYTSDWCGYEPAEPAQ